MAVESAFLSKSKQVETSHLLDAVKKTMPLAKLLKEEIDIQKEKLSKYAAVEANKKLIGSQLNVLTIARHMSASHIKISLECRSKTTIFLKKQHLLLYLSAEKVQKK